jgi:acetoin utilization deacetylase AcuC-like enzyme
VNEPGNDRDANNTSAMGGRRVGYAYNEGLIEAADRLPSNVGRARRVHALIEAFELVDDMETIDAPLIAVEGLKTYHDDAFIDYLRDAENADSDEEVEDDDERITKREKYGLEYDCSVFPGLWDYVRRVSGATVACADYLLQGRGTVAINWTGGRHHCRKGKARGFCYVNDVVLGLVRLRAKFDRIMYIDLDLHHGDGVEAGFYNSPNILTLSVHRFGKGFYPGTGRSTDRGTGRGTGYTRNIPCRRGLSDESLKKIVLRAIVPFKQRFDPQAVVVVCGADGLSRDPHKEWNLTCEGLASAVATTLEWSLPTLLLGGGGYHHQDTARLWALITTKAIHGPDSGNSWSDIPDHDFLSEYSSDAYQFSFPPNFNLPDENKFS